VITELLKLRDGLGIFVEVHSFPISTDNTFANLAGGPSLSGPFVYVKQFLETSGTTGGVLGGVAVQQTGVAMMAVAIAVAWLLIENCLELVGQAICVAHNRLFKLVWIESRGYRRLGSVLMIGWHRLIVILLFLRKAGSRRMGCSQ
jgi:hypothetical protein